MDSLTMCTKANPGLRQIVTNNTFTETDRGIWVIGVDRCDTSKWWYRVVDYI